jgi:hypothetical protein
MDYDESKLCELILYIVRKSDGDRKLGTTKLLKLLAYSDFEAYRRLGQPITGASYRKLPHGPAPRQAPEVIEILEERGELSESTSRVFNFAQRHYKALRAPDQSKFTKDEIQIVDGMIERFRSLGNKAIADRSHNDFIGWQMADDLDEIPYRTALLSNDSPTGGTLAAGAAALARLSIEVSPLGPERRSGMGGQRLSGRPGVWAIRRAPPSLTGGDRARSVRAQLEGCRPGRTRRPMPARHRPRERLPTRPVLPRSVRSATMHARVAGP